MLLNIACVCILPHRAYSFSVGKNYSW